MRRFITSVLINLIFLIPAAYADYSETRDLVLDAGQIDELVIDCGAGYLRIEGADEVDRIEVVAEIIVEDLSGSRAEEFIEKYANLRLRKKGSSAILVSTFDNSHGSIWSLFRNHSGLINLTVRVPKHMNLDIDDGSGEMWIRDIRGDIVIDDGSGEIEMDKILGYVEIDDGSGDIKMSDINGQVRIDDGSGDIKVRSLIGDVEVDDGSGDIEIRKVDGSVVVDDGSGDIDIKYVTQDVKIIDDGSGSVDIAHVDGRVRR